MHTREFEKALKALCMSVFDLRDESAVQIAKDIVFISTKNGIRFAQVIDTLLQNEMAFVTHYLSKDVDYYIFSERRSREINFVIVNAYKLRKALSKKGLEGVCEMEVEDLIRDNIPFEYHTIKTPKKCASLS